MIRVEHVRVKLPNGNYITGTKVTGKKTTVIFTRKLTDAEALRLFKKYEPNPPNIRGMETARRVYREFNRRDPQHIRLRRLDTQTPFIRVGQVPMVTYISDKTGRRTAYKHETNPRRMPVAYIHPTKNIMLILGGTLRVKRGWLDG